MRRWFRRLVAWEVFWCIVLLGHAAFAAEWWRRKAHGFPVLHPRFWANEFLPIVVIAGALGTAVLLWSRRAAKDLVLILPGVWAGAALAARVAFPVSARPVWLAALLGAAGLGFAGLGLVRRNGGPRGRAGLCAAGGLLAGLLLPLTQRAPEADTRPLNPPAEAADAADAGWQPPQRQGIVLADGVEVDADDGSIKLQHGPLLVRVEPLLTFYSHSPDRCWAWPLLLSDNDYHGPDRRCTGARKRGDGGGEFQFADDGESTLRVSPAGGGRIVEVDARTRIAQPVYTHQNTFSEITVIGFHSRDVSLTFSPCPDKGVEAVEYDYPYGRPARFAYLDAGGTFRVVEARSGEKGPFRKIASGRLGRSDPLAVAVCEEGQEVCRIRLDDWAAQASTSPSPSAGWGVPSNVLAFYLFRHRTRNAYGMTMVASLAQTGVGSGYDTVGHAAGTYRNRLVVERVMKRPATQP